MSVTGERREADGQHPDDLLPWYVNGTLQPEAQRAVERHLAACVACRDEVAVLQQLRAQVKATRVQAPGELGLARLLRQVAREERVRRAAPAWWRPALAAAAAVIVVQGALLAGLWMRPGAVTPLGGARPAGDVVLQVTFAPEATEARIREVLQEAGGTLVGGPGALGVYRVELDVQPSDQARIDAAIASLRGRPDVVTHVKQE